MTGKETLGGVCVVREYNFLFLLLWLEKPQTDKESSLRRVEELHWHGGGGWLSLGSIPVACYLIGCRGGWMSPEQYLLPVTCDLIGPVMFTEAV